MAAIASMIADWWAMDEQRILLSSIVGIFESSTMADLVFDGGGVIDARMVIRARQLLGDAKEKLRLIAMHSMTETEFEEQDLFDYKPVSEQGGTEMLRTYKGMEVIVDDSLPVDGDIYSTYVFARGAIGRGDGTPVDATPIEISRNTELSQDRLTHRRALVLHPLGVKWQGTAAGATPTNVELRTGGNWARVYERKDMGIVEIKHRVSGDTVTP